MWKSLLGQIKYFVLDWLEQPRQDKNLLYLQDEPNKPTKEEPVSYVLQESQFASVSTIEAEIRGLAQQGCPPSWLEESDSAGCDL